MIRRISSNEQGIAMLIALALITLLTVIALSLFVVTGGDSTRSKRDQSATGSYHAAEAGTNAYLSDLTESTVFFNSYMAKGEATRSDSNNVAHPSSPTSDLPWTWGSSWTYNTSAAADTGWFDLGNGYQYLLQVYPPNPNVQQGPGQVTTRIDVTGRPKESTDVSTWRTIETMIRPSALTDFQTFSGYEHHVRLDRDDDRPDLRRRGQEWEPRNAHAQRHRQGEPLRRGVRRRLDDPHERCPQVRLDDEPDGHLQAQQLRQDPVQLVPVHPDDRAGCGRRRRDHIDLEDPNSRDVASTSACAPCDIGRAKMRTSATTAANVTTSATRPIKADGPSSRRWGGAGGSGTGSGQDGKSDAARLSVLGVRGAGTVGADGT